ncbi:mannose-6-phosphate isomerase [Xylariaceae sp. FL1272]|nr:mannose-6-phosphate isomerase [Xylariaceae sp. FL1272]
MVLPVPLIRLQCGVNSYDWGKVGSDSAAAKFGNATPADGFTIQSDKSYAELWMGTHPSNPSKDVESGRSLLDLIESNAMLLGPQVTSRYGGRLPFLFKVLSIGKALSIQAHPNKQLAAQLHARDPRNYPDDNHKPEMAIAITDFEGLCGFRPLPEISHALRTISALRQLVGETAADHFITTVRSAGASDVNDKKALKDAFAALMESSSEDVATAAKALVAEAETKGDTFADGGYVTGSGATMAELVTRLNKQFPEDIGLFVLFFLNYVKLHPGEALFLKADDIHAYVSGDIIECMAASDNVVRAGFTPKFKDVKTLVDMLTYSYAPIQDQKMRAEPYPFCTMNSKAYSSYSLVTLYDPPIDEFSVIRSALSDTGAKVTFDPIDGPSIIICTSGRGTISVGEKTEEMKEGYVFFVGATARLVLESTGDKDEEFCTFKAFVEATHASNGLGGVREERLVEALAMLRQEMRGMQESARLLQGTLRLMSHQVFDRGLDNSGLQQHSESEGSDADTGSERSTDCDDTDGEN